jgi:plasmid stability protein
MVHTLTITIPDALYQRLKARAEWNQRSIEEEAIAILAASLGVSLPANPEADGKAAKTVEETRV